MAYKISNINNSTAVLLDAVKPIDSERTNYKGKDQELYNAIIDSLQNKIDSSNEYQKELLNKTVDGILGRINSLLIEKQKNGEILSSDDISSIVVNETTGNSNISEADITSIQTTLKQVLNNQQQQNVTTTESTQINDVLDEIRQIHDDTTEIVENESNASYANNQSESNDAKPENDQKQTENKNEDQKNSVLSYIKDSMKIVSKIELKMVKNPFKDFKTNAKILGKTIFGKDPLSEFKSLNKDLSTIKTSTLNGFNQLKNSLKPINASIKQMSKTLKDFGKNLLTGVIGAILAPFALVWTMLSGIGSMLFKFGKGIYNIGKFLFKFGKVAAQITWFLAKITFQIAFLAAKMLFNFLLLTIKGAIWVAAILAPIMPWLLLIGGVIFILWWAYKKIKKTIDEWGGLGGFFKSLWESIKDVGYIVWETLKGWAIASWNWLKDVGTYLWDTLKDFGKFLYDTYILPLYNQYIKPLIDPIIKLWDDKIKPAIWPFVESLTKLKDNIVKAFSAWNLNISIWDNLKNISGIIKDTISEWWQTSPFKTAYDTYIQPVIDSVKNLIDRIKNVWSKLSWDENKSFIENLMSFWNSITTEIKNWWKSSSIKTYWDKIVDYVSNLSKKISDWFKTTTVGKWLTGFMEKIQKLFDKFDIGGKAKAAAKAVYSGAKNAMSSVTGFFGFGKQNKQLTQNNSIVNNINTKIAKNTANVTTDVHKNFKAKPIVGPTIQTANKIQSIQQTQNYNSMNNVVDNTDIESGIDSLASGNEQTQNQIKRFQIASDLKMQAILDAINNKQMGVVPIPLQNNYTNYASKDN